VPSARRASPSAGEAPSLQKGTKIEHWLKTLPKDVLQKLEILADAAKPHSRDEWGRSDPIVTTHPRRPDREGRSHGAAITDRHARERVRFPRSLVESIRGASRALLAQQLHLVCAGVRVRCVTPQRDAAALCIPRVA
jgi:hypothetical protein